MANTGKTITIKQFDEFIKTVSSTNLNYENACKKVGTSHATMRAYIVQDKDREERYARALMDCCESMADDMIVIADSPLPMTEHGLDSAAVADKRLRVDTRKWWLSKKYPKKYGDKIDVTTQGEKINTQPVYTILNQDQKDKLEELHKKADEI